MRFEVWGDAEALELHKATRISGPRVSDARIRDGLPRSHCGGGCPTERNFFSRRGVHFSEDQHGVCRCSAAITTGGPTSPKRSARGSTRSNQPRSPTLSAKLMRRSLCGSHIFHLMKSPYVGPPRTGGMMRQNYRGLPAAASVEQAILRAQVLILRGVLDAGPAPSRLTRAGTPGQAEPQDDWPAT